MMFILSFLLLGAAEGKIYDRCELARELKFVHKTAAHQLGTWVCIAEHESQYNTSIVGHLNGDGSGDHGIFQISDQYWCSPLGKGRACGVACSQLEDDDISDDFLCAQKIYKEHTQLSGDGFNAWAVYRPHCKGVKSDSYIKDCFNDPEEPKSLAPAPIFAHGFFDTAAGRANSNGASLTAQNRNFEPFLNFESPSIVQKEEISLTTETPNLFSAPKSTPLANNRFFTSTLNPNLDLFFTPPTTTTFSPIISRTSTFTTPSTTSQGRNLFVFNPNRGTTGSVFPTAGSPSGFEFGKTFSSPLTKLFSQSTSALQADTVTRPAPVFIINGVKWY